MKPIIVTYSNFSYIVSDEAWYAVNNFEFGYFHRIGSHYMYRVYERDIKLIARPKQLTDK